MKSVALLAIVLVLLSRAATAGFDEAKAAMERGDVAAALDELRPLALGGDTLAQIVMGRIYATGEGVARNHVAAAKWYRLAAEGGSAVAQYRLAGMYREGKGVHRDLDEAARWYRHAADQNHVGSMVSLGLMHQHGEGVPKDHVKAEKRYRDAVRQGYRAIKGANAKPSMETAVVILDTAMATQALGSMYERGDGPPPNFARAYMWYSIGLTLTDSPMNKTVLDELAKKMSVEQIAEGKREAREWLARLDRSQKR